MKLLVFSDSHGRGRKIAEAMDIHRGVCDAVIFLGDGLADVERIREKYPDIPFFCVSGNCDFFDFSDTPEELCVNFDGVRILLCHGHKYGVKGSFGRIMLRARELEADAVFFGHTHAPLDLSEYVMDKRIQLFNPGSIAQGTYGVVNTAGRILVCNHGSTDI
ncbi:MAG: YfcE family phosphodiesterase [Clostridia bacterium]|nr:YfcE family phosphodiesterase [Clostridia bacterium]